MGWSYLTKPKEAVVDMLLRQSHFEDYALMDDALYGINRTEDGRRIIVVIVLESDAEGCGFKVLDEAMHPYYYQRPKRLLDLSEIPDESNWRKRCLELQAA